MRLPRRPPGFWGHLAHEAGLAALAGLLLSPLFLFDLIDEDFFLLALLIVYGLINALRRHGEEKAPLSSARPRSAAPRASAEEPEHLRALSVAQSRLTRARARLRRRKEADPGLQKILGGLAQEYQAVRRAAAAGETGAEAQATRLRRLGGALGELAEAAAAAPGSERGRQSAEALGEALERLRAQRADLTEMADEAAFEANLQTLRHRLPPARAGRRGEDDEAENSSS